MQAIFLYGSLMDVDVRHHVFADSIAGSEVCSAVAYGYKTMTYPGENFPVLVVDPAARARGQVLLSPGTEALERMAFYEGNEYAMASLDVELEDGRTLVAHYNQACNENLLCVNPWCFQQWQLSERDALVEMSRQYMERCWGKMSVEEADAVWRELRHLRTQPSAV